VPVLLDAAVGVVAQDKPKGRSKYIRLSELLRRVFSIETLCQKCQVPLRLISLIKSEAIAKTNLTEMHPPVEGCF
jgi:predicted secreted protein